MHIHSRRNCSQFLLLALVFHLHTYVSDVHTSAFGGIEANTNVTTQKKNTAILACRFLIFWTRTEIMDAAFVVWWRRFTRVEFCGSILIVILTANIACRWRYFFFFFHLPMARLIIVDAATTANINDSSTLSRCHLLYRRMKPIGARLMRLFIHLSADGLFDFYLEHFSMRLRFTPWKTDERLEMKWDQKNYFLSNIDACEFGTCPLCFSSFDGNFS